MITLASTAIPIDRIIPAIPGSVSVTSNAFRTTSSRTVYKINAIDDTTPGTLNITHIKIITSARPIAPAIRLVFNASSPSFAPTTFERIFSSSSESPPIRI